MAKNILVLEGTALWAKIFEPDTKFNPLGDYSISLQIPEADAAAMSEKLEDLIQAEFKAAVKKDPRLKNKLTTQEVYQTVYDRDTGDDTGNVEFKFKLKPDTTEYTIIGETKPVIPEKVETPIYEQSEALVGVQGPSNLPFNMTLFVTFKIVRKLDEVEIHNKVVAFVETAP